MRSRAGEASLLANTRYVPVGFVVFDKNGLQGVCSVKVTKGGLVLRPRPPLGGVTPFGPGAFVSKGAALPPPLRCSRPPLPLFFDQTAGKAIR
ncbi:Hypothetical protein NTJ_07960 [Nesidiocoris tenuis]|uniref:Uncharacterized protein n=1 Tax=Nesidiocoris tenuis TaxID=355587 RepID=A0ABN7ASG0_9HEMI|nr:Hypothetical protein NTJ_07960 [Nesidiocoris tenuis]